MKPLLSWPLGCLAGAAVAAWPLASYAQSINFLFPSGVSGFDQQLGVTVQSRARPLYEAPGLEIDGFDVRPRLDQSLFYNSYPTGEPGPGSWISHTSAGVSAASLWSRNSLSLSLGVDNFEYLALPSLDHTNWNFGLGGGYTIGDNQLFVVYSHQNSYQLGTGLGTVRTATPLLNQTDSAALSYNFDFGRFTVTPDLSATSYRFGSATVLGVPIDQKFLDRNALEAGVTTRFSLSEEGGLLFILRGIDNSYVNPQPGLPSNDSDNFLAMGGIDYQAKDVWRYRLLVGVEFSTFSAGQYASNTAPIVQGSVIWSPTGVLTLTGTLTRAVQAPQSAGTNGFVLSNANLVVDYELKRNVLLQGRGGAQYAQFLQGGAQTNVTVGGGISWLLNRNLRLSLDYDFTKQTGNNDVSTTPANPNTLTTGGYDQSVVGVTVHVAL